MSVQTTSGFSDRIIRRIAIVEGQPVCISKHAQERFLKRGCGSGRDIASGLERLDRKLESARLTTRPPAWIPAETDITLWIVFGEKSAMLCKLEGDMIVAVTFKNRALVSVNPRDDRPVRLRRKKQLEFDRIKSMEDWLDFAPEADNE